MFLGASRWPPQIAIRYAAMAYTIPSTDVIAYRPSAMREFHVYGVEWIDNLHFVLPPHTFVADAESYATVAKARFAEAGWEGDGDGDVGVLWLPSFVFPLTTKVPPTGVVVWHVKQQEDGISFLLSPIPLPFEEFSE